MSEAADQSALATGRAFVWHEVYGANLADILKFYTEALDFGTATMPMGEMGDYTMLTRNGVPVAGALGTEGQAHLQGIPPHWATYIGVDDVDARIEKSVALGAKLIFPAMDVPTVGRMALIEDPLGAKVWLFTPSTQG